MNCSNALPAVKPALKISQGQAACSSTINIDALSDVLKQPPQTSTRRLSAKLRPSESCTIPRRLFSKVGLVNNHCTGKVPYELTVDQQKTTTCRRHLHYIVRKSYGVSSLLASNFYWRCEELGYFKASKENVCIKPVAQPTIQLTSFVGNTNYSIKFDSDGIDGGVACVICSLKS